MTNRTTEDDKQRSVGYVWGSLAHSPTREWLTVAGSARRRVALTQRPGQAARPEFALTENGKPLPWTLAKVLREGGTMFRVLNVVDEFTPEAQNA